jgi:hypothetical protein
MGKKRKAAGWLIPAVLALVLLAAALLYTRPVTLTRLCRGTSLSGCVGAEGSWSRAPAAETRFAFGADDPRLTELIALFEGRTFRRSLRSLLPAGVKTHRTTDGDVKWDIAFLFAPVTLRDGSTGSGALLQARDFYGVLELSFDGALYRCTTDGQAAFLADVTDCISVP